MKKMFLIFVSILLSFFVYNISAKAVSYSTQCQYSLKNINSYAIKKNEYDSFTATDLSRRTISDSARFIMDVADDYQEGDQDRSNGNIKFSVSGASNVSIEETYPFKNYPAYKQAHNIPDGYGIDALVNARKCHNLDILYYKDGDNYYIVNVGFDQFGDMSEYSYDMMQACSFYSDKEMYLANIATDESIADSVTTCEYSLAYIPNQIIEAGAGDTYNIKSNVPTTLSTDSKLYMDISRTDISGESDISFRSTSDGSISLNYIGGRANSKFNAEEYMVNQGLSSNERASKLSNAKKCPDLAIIYYKQKYADTYLIIDVLFKNDKSYEELLASVSETSAFPKKIKAIENQSEGIMIGFVSKYDEETNSINSVPEIADFCKENPSNSYCTLLSRFTGGRNLDDSSFSFCYSKGVLKTIRIIHILIILAKILTPIILIGTGSITFAKAMLADDEKSLANAAKKLIFSLVVSVVVFFVPTIVNGIMSLVTSKRPGGANCRICLSESVTRCDEIIEIVSGD